MERRPASHTEEEELNQRRRLLNLARKGDPKAITKLFELYQVRVYSGEHLSKTGRPISLPTLHKKPTSGNVRTRATAARKRADRRAARPSRRPVSARSTARRRVSRRKVSSR
jgi:hypothetical protein